MPVVINEVEVETKPETPAPAPEQGQSANGAPRKDPEKQIREILRTQHQRNHRLEAY
jgi:hypothetical protein